MMELLFGFLVIGLAGFVLGYLIGRTDYDRP
jgi:hypothetical protein